MEAWLLYRRLLKYLPALVLALLIVAWVELFYCSIGFNADHWSIGGRVSTLELAFATDDEVFEGRPGWIFEGPRLRRRHYFGEMDSGVEVLQGEILAFAYLPIPLLLTAVLPLAIGSFTSFRFRLWHYLAYTALTAFQFAYYLQWQE